MTVEIKMETKKKMGIRTQTRVKPKIMKRM